MQMEMALSPHVPYPQTDTLDITETLQGIGTEPRSAHPDSGPRALMRAILQDAIFCVQGNAADVPPPHRNRVAAQARRWILSRDTTWIFSFESICHVLDIEPDCVRRYLFRSPPSGAAVRTRSTLRSIRLRGNQRGIRIRIAKGSTRRHKLHSGPRTAGLSHTTSPMPVTKPSKLLTAASR